MKLVFATLVIAAGLAAPAWAQSATDAITQAAKEAATQTAVDSIDKATGTKGADHDKKMKKDKDGPNWGKSEDHRQDDDHGHKGKKHKKD